MRFLVTIHRKRVQVVISKKAYKKLALRHKPLVAVVHLIFGCMVAKRVWFKEDILEEFVAITDNLAVCFDVVRYTNCSFSNIDGGAEPEPYPIKGDIKRYVPDYLYIDFVKNKYSGDFSFTGGNSIEEPLEKEAMSCRSHFLILTKLALSVLYG